MSESLAERAIDEMGIGWRTIRQRQSCKVRPFANSDAECGNAGKRHCQTCGTLMCDECIKSTAPSSLDCEVCHRFHYSN